MKKGLLTNHGDKNHPQVEKETEKDELLWDEEPIHTETFDRNSEGLTRGMMTYSWLITEEQELSAKEDMKKALRAMYGDKDRPKLKAAYVEHGLPRD